MRPAHPRVVVVALVALVALAALVAPVAAIAGARIATVRSGGSRTGGAARTRQTSPHSVGAKQSRMRCRSPLASVSSDSHPAVARPRRVRNRFGTRMFGIAAGGQLQSEPPAELRSDIADDARTGARWLRVDINWAQIEQRRGRFFWRQVDRVVAHARNCGLHVLGTILYAPAWAQVGDAPGVRPPDPSLYAHFAANAARHLKGRGVSAFEIWNEPNVAGFWSPRPDPRAYTKVLRRAYRAIKRVDRRATVVSGGLAPAVNTATTIDPRRFLKGMYRAGAKNHFDALGHHPYTFPGLPGQRVRGSAWFEMSGSATSLRSIMVAHGDGAKKIWGTEFGAPTWGPRGSVFVSLDEQARIIERAYHLWAGYRWAGPLFTYQGRDLGYRADTNENFFGLLEFNGTPKPAFSAFQSETLAVAGAEAERAHRDVASRARARKPHRHPRRKSHRHPRRKSHRRPRR
jgi:polysaccharide biosynthesis protein PslG